MYGQSERESGRIAFGFLDAPLWVDVGHSDNGLMEKKFRSDSLLIVDHQCTADLKALMVADKLATGALHDSLSRYLKDQSQSAF